MEQLTPPPPGWFKWRGVTGLIYARSPVATGSLGRDVLRSTDEAEVDRMIAEWDAAHPDVIIDSDDLLGAPWPGWRPPWNTSKLF